MLEWVGMGIVMENVVDEFKSIVMEVILFNDNDGIVVVLVNFF